MTDQEPRELHPMREATSNSRELDTLVSLGSADAPRALANGATVRGRDDVRDQLWMLLEEVATRQQDSRWLYLIDHPYTNLEAGGVEAIAGATADG